MKLSFVVASAAVAAAVASPLTEEQYQFLFSRFVDQYSKQYPTAEFFSRYNTFKSNLDFVVNHNAKNLSYTTAINQFGDLTNKEFKSLMSLKTVKAPYANNKLRAKLPVVNGGNTDWVKAGKVNKIKDQGQCGSCWAFSATTSLETTVAIASGSLPNLAEQELVDCAGSYGNMGCNGGLMTSAFEYIKASGGLCTTAEYPYTAADGSCKASKCSHKIGAISGYNTLSGEKDFTSALATTVISIAVGASSMGWQFYSSGILTASQCDAQIDHGVAIVASGSQAGQDYWVVRNSWGVSWGQDGYIWLAANQNTCGLDNNYASFPVVSSN